MRASVSSVRSRRGAFLLGALWVNAMILLAVVGSTPFVLNTIQTTRHSYVREQTFGLAEAGVAHARYEIVVNNGANLPTTIEHGEQAAGTWQRRANDVCGLVDGGPANDTVLYGVTVASCYRFLSRNLSAGDVDAGVPGPTIGTYTVWVANANGVDVRIVGRGSINNIPSATRIVTVDLQRPNSIVRYGLFSDVQVRVGDRGPVFLDSYRSSLGAYNPLAPRSNAGIAANGFTVADAIRVLRSTVNVKGILSAPAGENIVRPLGWNPDVSCSTAACPEGYDNNMTPAPLPHVQIPTGLDALPVTTVIAGVTGSGQGDFLINGTYTCNAPLRVRSLYVTGTLNMTDGCQLFVDATNADGTIHEPNWKPGGAAIDTDGTGSLLKTGSGPTQIFVRNRGIDFDGGGVSYQASVPVANRRPENLQIFVTCSQATCPNGTIPGDNNVAQRNHFYGMIYVEGGKLSVYRASENGTPYDTHYHGAFASTNTLNIEGLDGMSPYVHFDEDLVGLSFDGSGQKGYRVKAGSWNMP